MDAVLRAVAIYLILFALFRIFGKRTLSEMTTLDFVLLLVVGEATQQALLGEDFSITQAAIVVATLMVVERLWDLLSWRFPGFRKFSESQPVVLMADGRLDRDAMDAAQVTEEDILQAARKTQGLASMAEIRHVVMETSGGLSIIPVRHGG